MRKDCQCPRARHKHGTKRAYLYDWCRCKECTAANSAWHRDYRRQQAERRWNGGSAWCDSTGTRRRIQALSAAGWSPRYLGAQLGISVSGVRWLRNVDGRCLVKTADRVRDLYNLISHETPTGPAVERTARWGERLGWVEPWQWAGRDIDDPNALPYVQTETPGYVDEIAVQEAINGRKVRLNRAETSEAVARLTRMGQSADQIAERLGVTSRTVVRYRGRVEESVAA